MAILCPGTAVDTHLANSTAGVNFTSATGTFSVTTWISAVWSSSSFTQSMVGLYGPLTPTTAVQIGCRAGGNQVDVWTWGGGVLISSPASSITDNTWTHVAYTFDGTSHRLYLNGILVNTTTTAQLTGVFAQVYVNGYPGGGTNEVSNHKVDNYAYFNRVLTANEILTMSSVKGARHGIVDGLLAAYEFDDGIDGATASSIRDISGNGNDLAVIGAGSPIVFTYSGAVASSNLRQVQ